MKLGIINLGCPKNTVDTEVMVSYLRDFQLTSDPKQADYIIINTCAFLASARKESSDAIEEMLKKSRARVIVAGCFPSKEGRKLVKKHPGVYAWVGVNDIANIRHAVTKGGVYLDHEPYVYGKKEHVVLINSYSAYVKISEGCNHRCSFCTIPSIKGAYRSRMPGDIASEVASIVDAGVKEVNLISQDLTYYGMDNYGKPVLAFLLKKILKKTKKKFWLRLLYLYPDIGVIRSVVRVMKKDSRICRYIDIPFQHVDDRILRSMRRGYDRERIGEVVELLRKEVPGITIRSSFITGYPGETVREFEELLGFIKAGYVDRPGVFGYSDEPGTCAHKLTGKVAPAEIARRSRIIKLESEKICDYNNSKTVGSVRRVLVTGIKSRGIYYGRTEGSAPDIDSYTIFRSTTVLNPGDMVNVLITGAKGADLYGERKSGK
ncbi:MAG: 30S ribosomal protein S12 methylthiotransferase RimO [Spirochaetia bacterium]|nr:30S ribosomal protein S12 methylthiotransferase RimO [Spirochaetia bacterium]